MENSKPACARAYQLIKAKIIHNEFDPRKRINELTLANELKISRTPVREALIMLEKDNLITRYDQNRGFYLTQYSLKDVVDLYEFREMIETAVVPTIIAQITDQDIQALYAILADVDEIIRQNRPGAALVRAVDFHLYYIEKCINNSFVIESLRNSNEKLIMMCWSCSNIQTCILSAGEHLAIMDALSSGEEAKLQTTIRHHIQGARSRIIETIKDYSQKLYFIPTMSREAEIG